MNDGSIFDLVLAGVGLYLAIRYKHNAKVAIKQTKEINGWLPKWVPWPIRLSDKEFDNKELKLAQLGYIIFGILLFFIGIKQFLT